MNFETMIDYGGTCWRVDTEIDAIQATGPICEACKARIKILTDPLFGSCSHKRIPRWILQQHRPFTNATEHSCCRSGLVSKEPDELAWLRPG
jgi:hypothetical protein